MVLLFVSSVISYGSQTIASAAGNNWGFESSVISYGSQTIASATQINAAFESSVIPYDSLISCCEIKRYLIVVIGWVLHK